MAKGKKTGGKDFVPGQVANPAGSPGLPQDLKNARSLNKVEMERIFNRFLYAGDQERAEVMADPAATGIEKLVATIMDIAIENGDQQRLEFILQRVIGKVKEQLEVTGLEPFVITRPSGDKVEIGVKKKEEG